MDDQPAPPEPSGPAVVRIPLTAGWRFRRVGDAAWLPATAPGCVHTDLLANERIGDPFYRTNERRQGWIERQDWEYSVSFAVTPETLARARVDLVFEGLDTFAEVLVNDQPVLSADNMFRRWRVPVRPFLRAGENDLRVRFRSPIEVARPAHAALDYPLEAVNDQGDPKLSVFARKAPYHYGWDWGPRLVTSGVWRPVRLEAWDDARIEDVRVIQRSLDEACARLTVVVTVEAMRAGPGVLTVRIPDGPATKVERALDAGRTEIELDLTIEAPRRWWPNGLGEAHLYAVVASVSTDRGQDTAQRRIGLRTVALEHQRDAHGKSFTFVVNGVPVFMKGANWIPADSFPSRLTPARYRSLLEAAAAAHMNMLRVWGGGIYEDDVFYDLCDELGILVWQDFMFACSVYPDDEAFVENVRQEAIENVIRLRNHACLALWAGNNEIEAAWHHWGWKLKYAVRGVADRVWRGYQRLFHEVLPAVVHAHDPGRPYTRSSPSANEDAHVNERGWGDSHYWGVWHLKLPYTAYDDNVSRFMSEYGFQSFPELATVETYTLPEDRSIDSEVMRAHQRHGRGNELIAAYLAEDFPPPRDFAGFLYLGQLLQAEVIKYAAEAHRRARPYCMGSLYWQLDDCWPVASWSGIDHHGRWKALHFHARRFFAPVLVTVRLEKGEVVVHGISDRLTATTGVLRVRAVDFAGRDLTTWEAPVVLPPNAATLLYTAPLSSLLAGLSPRETLVVAELMDGQARLARNVLYPAKAKDQRLPAPGLQVGVRRDGGDMVVTVGASHLARHVWLTAATPGTFSDNGFDLLPGEQVEVRSAAPGAMDVEAFRRILTVVTLADFV